MSYDEPNDPFMEEYAAEAEAQEAENQQKLKDKRARLTEQAVKRNLQQQAQGAQAGTVKKIVAPRPQASAPVQQNLTELPGGVYQDPRTGKFFDASGAEISAQAASLRLQKVTDTDQFTTSSLKDTDVINQRKRKQKYIENVQSYLINNIESFDIFFRNIDNRDLAAPLTANIHKLNPTVPPGAFTSLITSEGFTSRGDNLGISAFVDATPAQLANLMPLLRFFMVDQDGNQEEIFFSEYTTEQFEEQIAKIRRQGTILDSLKPRAQRGSTAGIRSFEWNYNNKHEGDYIIEAQLELFFGTLAELANISYLQFLFPTGGAADLAKDIDSKASTIQGQEQNRRSSTPVNDRTTAIQRLTAKSKKYTQILSKGNKDLGKLGSGFSEEKAAKKKEFRQLKVVTGWSLPDGDANNLIELFDTHDHYKSFKLGVEATQRAIYLNLYDYNVEFQQECPRVLTLSYLGSSDNYLATGGSDIFGSNNFKNTSNQALLYRETEISTAGFINFEDKTIDAANTDDVEGLERAVANNAFAVSPLKAKDPYLSSVRQGRNTQGETTIKVTLAGLKLAQDLALTELKIANLQQEDPEGPRVSAIRRRGEYIVLLYERALNLQLRNLYSSFLRQLTDRGEVYRARIEIKNGKTQLFLDGKVIARRERAAAIRRLEQETRTSAPRPGDISQEDIDNVGDKSSLVYYMRLGDILKAAMVNADMRDDISLILGNVQNKSGVEYSLYDMPISLDTFGQYFYNRVVANKLRMYPFRSFLDNMLSLTARMINQNPDTAERIAFDYTVISSSPFNVRFQEEARAAAMISGRPGPDPNFAPGLTLSEGELRQIGLGEAQPLDSGGKNRQFYAVFSRRSSHKNRTGDKMADIGDGIFHYVIGSDRGLA